MFKFNKNPENSVSAYTLPDNFTYVGENTHWYYFDGVGGAEISAAFRKEQNNFEDLLNGNIGELPPPFSSLYEITIYVAPEHINTALVAIGKYASELPINGKVVKPTFSGQSSDIPPIVLHTSDRKAKYVLEAGMQIDNMLNELLGACDLESCHAFALPLGTRVFIQQGEYSTKKILKARNPELFDKVFGPSGALFFGIEELFEEKIGRARNQLRIYEMLKDFYGMSISEKLLLLQKEILSNVSITFNLGIRYGEVKMGNADGENTAEINDNFNNGSIDYNLRDYYAPFSVDVPNLLHSVDTLFDAYYMGVEEVQHIPENELDRLCAVIYVTLIGIHPLADANGQSAMNVVSSVVHDLGSSKYFVRNPFLAKYRTAAKFSHIFLDVRRVVIDPISEELILEENDEKNEKHTYALRAINVAQKANKRMLSLFLSEENREFVINYIKTGIFNFKMLKQGSGDQVYTLVNAINSATRYFGENRTDTLLGDLEDTYEKLQYLHEQALTTS